ncbi:unnamed protein product, partial [Adineta ricciae]
SSVSQFNVRLPSGDANSSLLDLTLIIRDTFDCITELNMTSVVVKSDPLLFAALMNILQNPSTTNPLLQILSSGNQNILAQLLTSISQHLNQLNDESVSMAILNGVPASSIYISSLLTQTLPTASGQFNQSALNAYKQQLNTYANILDYLVPYTQNLLITTSNSIRLQAAMLNQLTQATNQLTRTSAMIASRKCYKLAQSLYSMATRIPFEDVQSAVEHIAQCASNVLTSVNSPLQERSIILDLDYSRANTFPRDYDTDLESPWSNPNLFADENNFSWEAIGKGRNLYYQKQLASEISAQADETTALLTSALNIHLNIGQNLTINVSTMFMSVEILSLNSIVNRINQPLSNIFVHLPTTLNLNASDYQTFGLRSIVQKLSTFDELHTETFMNMSRTFSLTILDQYGNELPVRTNFTHPFEFRIPRDSIITIPQKTLQNVTSFNSLPHHLLFNLHYVDLIQAKNLSVSVHIEIHSLDASLGYLFVYKFDDSPRLESSIDGWTFFCASSRKYSYIQNRREMNV